MAEINRAGGSSDAVHGQIYDMSTLLRAGSPEPKKRSPHALAAGKRRLETAERGTRL